MDFQKQIYAKTPIGDEAVRQSTRVVQRNLRMVLVQVDGKLTVEELAAKIGNPRLVEKALRELETGGFITPTLLAPKVWEESKRQADSQLSPSSVISRFSSFSAMPPSSVFPASVLPPSAGNAASGFSSFGKPILPAGGGSLAMAVERDDAQDADDLSRVRKIPIGRLLAWFFPLLAGLLLLTLLFYPYSRLKPEISAAAGRYLQTSVNIGNVGVTFWPRPALLLSDVQLGDSGDFTIRELRIASLFALLGSGTHQIARVDLDGVSVSADRLAGFPILRRALPSKEFAVEQIVLENVAVSAGDLLLKGLSGKVEMAAGDVSSLSFQSADHSLRISMKPGQDGVALDVEAFGWQPFEEGIKFDSLQAEALLLPGRLNVRSFDARLLGGAARGGWLFDWQGALSMEGNAGLTGMDARRLTAAFVPALRLDGELSGTMSLRAGGKRRERLFDNLDVALEADIVRGMLYGVDLGEAARRGMASDVRAGSTKFDRLRASLSITPRQVLGRNVQIYAGMFTAGGQFHAGPGGNVDGTAQLSVNSSVSTLKAPVRIFGRLPDLTVSGH